MDVSVTTTCAGCQRQVACQAPEGAVNLGDYCVIETKKGLFLGKVSQTIPSENKESKCKCKVLRKASAEDIAKAEKNSALEKKAFDFCMQRIQARQLSMKLVGIEHMFDGSKAVFYFTADGRVDFRELVRDLAYELRTRIEMKQIGVRDEAKMLGGFGCCGLPLCCSTFLKDFEPVSIRMAKVQNLTLDPAKISGACGRLMCCLGYESKDYEKTRKAMPKMGDILSVDGENAKVRKINVLTETILLEFAPDRLVQYSLQELRNKTGGFKKKKRYDSPKPQKKQGN